MKRLPAAVFAAIGVMALFGCESMNKKVVSSQPSALLEPSAVQKFSDIPVPAKFKFISENSYSFESAGVRVGVLRYQGKALPQQVVNFYKEQMPMYNWALLNVVEYGEYLMNFDRENETCVINITPKGSSAIITVSVGPKAKKQDRAAK